MADEGKGADPGQITVSRYDKKELKAEMAERAKAAQKTPGLPCGCEECVDCGECKADLAKARLRRQNTLVTRLNSRVLALLEQATAT